MKNGFLIFRGCLRRRPARLIMTALCAFFCFLSYFGLFAAQSSIEKAENEFLMQCGTADVIISTETTEPDALYKMLSDIEGVSGFSGAYIFNTTGVCSDGITRTVRLLGIDKNSIISPVLNGDGEYFVSYGYVSDFGSENISNIILESGPELDLSGICYLPSYTSVYIDRFTVSTSGDIVDVFTDIENVWKISGEQKINFAYVNVEDGADVDAVIKSVSENGDVFTEYAIPFDDEPSFSTSRRLSYLVLGICRLFPVILFGTGLIFIYIFLSGIASMSRKTAAVLLSDGESTFGIIWGFFLSAIFSVSLGMLLACPASFFLAKAVTENTVKNMGIPYTGLSVSPLLIFAGIGLCLAVSISACAICTLTVKRQSIIKLKRRQKKKRLSAVFDVLTSCICSAAALTLVLTTCMYRDSVSAVREEVFFERYGYDAEIIYSDFVPLSELDKIASFAKGVKTEPIIIGSAELSFNGESCRVLGIGISENSAMLNFTDNSGNRVLPVENRILLAGKTAETLGASEEDIIEAEVTYGNRRIDVMCLASGISRQYSSFTQIISIDTVTEYLDSSGVMNGALVTLGENDSEAFLSYVKNLDGVYAVQLKDGAIRRFDNRFSAVQELTKLIIYNGTMLGFFIFILMGYSTWRKNLRKNSILIMLGESPCRIALYDLARGFFGAFLGLVAGIPLSVFTETKILSYLSDESTAYPLILREWTVLLGVLIILSYSAVSAIGYAAATKFRAKDIL